MRNHEVLIADVYFKRNYKIYLINKIIILVCARNLHAECTAEIEAEMIWLVTVASKNVQLKMTVTNFTGLL